MSIKVELYELAATMETYGFAYYLTVGDDGRPHAVAVSPTWMTDGGALVLDVGKRTASNSAARTKVSLVFPPVEDGGYSLIVDGNSSLCDAGVRFEPTNGVLHRPASPISATDPSGAGALADGCGSDCVPVPITGD